MTHKPSSGDKDIKVGRILAGYRAKADLSYSEVRDGVYTLKQYYKAVDKLTAQTTQSIKQLLYNELKEKMPQSPSIHRPLNGTDYARGFNQCLEDVHKVIKQVMGGE